MFSPHKTVIPSVFCPHNGTACSPSPQVSDFGIFIQDGRDEGWNYSCLYYYSICHLTIWEWNWRWYIVPYKGLYVYGVGSTLSRRHPGLRSPSYESISQSSRRKQRRAATNVRVGWGYVLYIYMIIHRTCAARTLTLLFAVIRPHYFSFVLPLYTIMKIHTWSRVPQGWMHSSSFSALRVWKEFHAWKTPTAGVGMHAYTGRHRTRATVSRREGGAHSFMTASRFAPQALSSSRCYLRSKKNNYHRTVCVGRSVRMA